MIIYGSEELLSFNQTPILDTIEDKVVNEGELLEFTVTADDPDGDNLTYSVTNIPTGATFNPGTQIFSWEPDLGQAGDYTVVFTVTDDGDPPLNDSDVVTITVKEYNEPPVASDHSVATLEDMPADMTLTAADADDDPLTFVIV